MQLHPVSGSVGGAGLQLRPQQSELLSVCGAVHQDPAGRGQEQEEEGEASLNCLNTATTHDNLTTQVLPQMYQIKNL